MKGNRLPYSERKLRNEMWIKGYLWCAGECQSFLSVDKFWKNRSNPSGNYGYRTYCKECENKKRDKPLANKYHKKRNKSVILKAASLMGDCCQKCGYTKSPSALDYHHVYPSEKLFNVKQRLYSKGICQETINEMDKCCLLCSNCHGRYTAGEWKAEFIQRIDGCGYTVGDPLPLDDDRYDRKPPKIEQRSLQLTYGKPKPTQLRLLDSKNVYFT